MTKEQEYKVACVELALRKNLSIQECPLKEVEQAWYEKWVPHNGKSTAIFKDHGKYFTACKAHVEMYRKESKRRFCPWKEVSIEEVLNES